MSVPAGPAGRSSRNFSEPETFHPERWLSDPNFASDDLDSSQVFSVGPRNCIGKKYVFTTPLVLGSFSDVFQRHSFAMAEMRMIIALVLFNFDIALDKDMKSWGDGHKYYNAWIRPSLRVHLTPVAA